jgi:hypothetical protein
MPTIGINRWDWHKAAPGYTFYLPDLYYFFGADPESHQLSDFPIARAAHVTAHCSARWSDRYWATPSFEREPQREGPLPDTPKPASASSTSCSAGSTRSTHTHSLPPR